MVNKKLVRTPHCLWYTMSAEWSICNEINIWKPICLPHACPIARVYYRSVVYTPTIWTRYSEVDDMLNYENTTVKEAGFCYSVTHTRTHTMAVMLNIFTGDYLHHTVQMGVWELHTLTVINSC